MPRLGIELDNNIKKTTSDFKQLNTQVDKTGKGVRDVDKSTSGLGKTMANSFKLFLIGGALERGFSKILSDVDNANRKAKALADSYRTLRFLGTEEDIASAKATTKQLAEQFGISPSLVGPTAAEVKSTAGDFSTQTRARILMGSGAAQAGGIGDFRKFAATTTQMALLNKQFQTPEGIGMVENLLSQGITEAKLDPSEIDILGSAVISGTGAGLSEAESIAQFAGLTTLTTTKDDAKEKFKQVALQYTKSGARAKGISFNDWIDIIAKTSFDKLPEPLQTLHSLIIKMSSNRKSTEGKTSRMAAAQSGGVSLPQLAFQKQLDDPSTAASIYEDIRVASQEAATPETLEELKTKKSDASVKVIGSAIWASILDAAVGGQGDTDTTLGPLGEYIRGAYRETIREAEPVAAERDKLSLLIQKEQNKIAKEVSASTLNTRKLKDGMQKTNTLEGQK